MENLREEGIRTRCWMRSERDGNEIQALHLATFPFVLPQPQMLVKTRFLKFRAPVSAFFLLFLLSSTLLFSAFHLSILSDVWLLNFLWTYIHFKVSRIAIDDSTFSPHKTLRARRTARVWVGWHELGQVPSSNLHILRRLDFKGTVLPKCWLILLKWYRDSILFKSF